MKYDTVESFAIFSVSGEPIAPSETSSTVFIPSWIRSNAYWWTENRITDDDFATSIEFMIKEKIILIFNLIPSDSSEIQIPDWVKNTTTWWADGLILDQEFTNAVKFLVTLVLYKFEIFR